jgi:hypothetical protein
MKALMRIAIFCLIANQPADQLYRKHRFEYLPENKCGMLRNQRKDT